MHHLKKHFPLLFVIISSFPALLHAATAETSIKNENQSIQLNYTLKWNNLRGKASYFAQRNGDHYMIKSQAQGSGLARILGTAIMKSEGVIDGSQHLKPLNFSIEKPFTGKIELASFNWPKHTVTLKDGNNVELKGSNIHDPLSLLFQFYWTPATKVMEPLTVVTTKKVGKYFFKAAGTEVITFNNKSIQTQIWKRYDEAGTLHMTVWLSPEHRFIPIKIQDYNGPDDIKELSLNTIEGDL